MQRRLPSQLVLSMVTVAMNGDPSNGGKNVTGPSIKVLYDNWDIIVGPGTSQEGAGPPAHMLSRAKPASATFFGLASDPIV